MSSSASTEETTEIEQHKLTSKQKQRFSSFFGAKSSQQEQVCAQLNEYSRTGIPEKSSRDFFNNPDHKEAMAYLDTIEGSWKDFVNCEGMSNNEIKIQTAIWELVTTECDYIHILLTLTDVCETFFIFFSSISTLLWNTFLLFMLWLQVEVANMQTIEIVLNERRFHRFWKWLVWVFIFISVKGVSLCGFSIFLNFSSFPILQIQYYQETFF